MARQAVKADVRSSRPRRVLADTLARTRDLEGAFNEYAEALRLDPTATDLAPVLATLGLATGRNR